MNNLTSELIDKIIQEQINKNQEQIVNQIAVGANDTMSTEQVCAQMIANSIKISTQISVKIILELLF